MRRSARALAALLPALLLLTASAEEPVRASRGEFGRVVGRRLEGEGESNWVIQTSVRELRHPKTGVSVLLLSMHHLSKPEYFRALTRFVADADLVLREAEPDASDFGTLEDVQLPETVRWLRRLSEVEQRLLNVQNQRDWEASLEDDRWKYADMEPAEIRQRLIGVKLPENIKVFVEGAEHALASKSEARRARAAEQALADSIGSILNWERGEPGLRSIPEFADLQERRERRIWAITREHLASGRYKRVALVYGASHTYQLEPLLVRELGFRLHATWWIDALTYRRVKTAD